MVTKLFKQNYAFVSMFTLLHFCSTAIGAPPMLNETAMQQQTAQQAAFSQILDMVKHIGFLSLYIYPLRGLTGTARMVWNGCVSSVSLRISVAVDLVLLIWNSGGTLVTLPRSMNQTNQTTDYHAYLWKGHEVRHP